jgi:DNA-binding transcriptional LysR family regulator
MQLRIGAIESVLHSWLIDWVRQMSSGSSEFELELTVETTPILLEQLRRGTLDIAFAALPASGDGLRSKALPPMEMVFVGHRELHRKRRYGLADLAALELLTFQRGSQPHVALVDHFRASGWGPHRVHNISSISAMLQLVERGFGVATLPLAAVQGVGDRLPLKVLRTDLPLAPLPVHASHREDPGSPLAREVVEAAVAFIGASKGASKKVHRKNR